MNENDNAAKLYLENAETISLIVPANGATKIPFTENSNLRGKKVYAIEVIQDTGFSTDPHGNPFVDANQVFGSYLSLTDENGKREKIKDLPLIALLPYYNAGVLRYFKPMTIDLQKSYIIYTGPSSLVAGEAYCFVFYFKDE
jgi:hypothetical protein